MEQFILLSEVIILLILHTSGKLLVMGLELLVMGLEGHSEISANWPMFTAVVSYARGD